ncbi:MAG: acyl-CoA/acyl-ACP dehydrogenase [Acidimicrobiales bacterium]|jgi:alkylation response protein AidB-like acyl-CoA dehydrogenase|nr:acyl-CoA/acyl-ACP dehydrogenase [Acidimicrobiales bacterium]
MDFELSDDQVALQEGLRSFCQGRLPMAAVRELEATGGIDRALWRELAEMGVFALRLPEADGGVGLGWADAVLAFEELGRAIVPGPLVWTHLVAGLVEGAAEGTAIVGGLPRDDQSRLVEYAPSLDALVVLDDAGAWLVDPSSLELEPVAHPLDPLVPVWRVTGLLPQGERIVGVEDPAALQEQGAALVAATMLGVAEAATDLAVGFAKERVQFDRPIGAFQALKHLMADMFVRAEVARGAVYAAGVTLDDPAVGSVRRAVAAARITAAEAALGNGKTCVQVHGGMGYTWEVDAHLLLKRAYALEPAFGGREEWEEAMADLVAQAG